MGLELEPKLSRGARVPSVLLDTKYLEPEEQNREDFKNQAQSILTIGSQDSTEILGFIPE